MGTRWAHPARKGLRGQPSCNVGCGLLCWPLQGSNTWGLVSEVRLWMQWKKQALIREWQQFYLNWTDKKPSYLKNKLNARSTDTPQMLLIHPGKGSVSFEGNDNTKIVQDPRHNGNTCLLSRLRAAVSLVLSGNLKMVPGNASFILQPKTWKGRHWSGYLLIKSALLKSALMPGLMAETGRLVQCGSKYTIVVPVTKDGMSVRW